MSEVFIPPAGAHQFEFNKGPLPGDMRPDMPGGRAPRRPDWVWVGSPVRNQGSCECVMVYPVLIEGLPDDIRRFARKSMKLGPGHPVECACRAERLSSKPHQPPSHQRG